jgi:GH35 family endo-1,4-beta-xylanase
MNLPNKSSCIRTATALLLCSFPACAQIAKDATKYLGNISEGQTMLTDFASYWNHVAPENGGKWAAVEMQRDHMVWTGLDNMASYARDHKIPWTFHTLLWGSAIPVGWPASARTR